MAHRPTTVAGPSLGALFEGAPPGIVIGAAVAVVTWFVVGGLTTWLLTRADHLAGWSSGFLHGGRGLAMVASAATVHVMYLAGLTELARRGERGRLLWPALAGLAAILAVSAVDFYVELGTLDRDGWAASWPAWRGRAMAVAALIVSGSLVAAGWPVARVRLLAGPLLLATMLAYPWSGLADVLNFAARGDSGGLLWLQWLVDLVIVTGFAAAVLLVSAELGRTAPQPASDLPRVGAGLYRAGSALVAGIVVSLLAVGLLIAIHATRDPDLVRTAEWSAPLAALLASIAVTVALLQAGGRLADDAPRFLLHGAAAAILWAALAATIKAATLFASHYHPPEVRVNRVIEVFPYLIPLITLAGLLAVLSAITALRRAAPGAVEASTLSTAVGMAVVLSVGALILDRWARDGGVGDRVTRLMVDVGVALAVIVAHLAVARVCHRMGAALRDRGGLPGAVAREPG